MSIFSGLSVSVERLSCLNCFRRPRDADERKTMARQLSTGRELVDVSERYNITTLPVMTGRELVDLYPPTNHVECWNVLIVGKHKNYILVNLKDVRIPNSERLLNQQGDPFLPRQLRDFFNHVWDKTLAGEEMQFFMLWSGKTYFVNTYRFVNGAQDVIGAIMFMRLLELMPDLSTRQERNSIDLMAEFNLFRGAQ